MSKTDRAEILGSIEDSTIIDLIKDEEISDEELEEMLKQYLATRPATPFTDKLKAALAGTSSEE